MRKIKICGLTRPEDIAAANQFQPDYIGFVFAESRRRVDEKTAEELRRLLNPRIKAVGVFVDEAPDTVVSLLLRNVIDMAQLHGGEGEDEISYIRKKTGKLILQAVRVRNSGDIRQAEKTIADGLIFDEGKGSGTVFEWGILRQYLKENGSGQLKPYFLAGGICPENIEEALKIPSYGIDLSGGAESGGQKDPEKMKILIKTVHKA